MIDLPMLIKRCLTHKVRIYPYQLSGVLSQYERKQIPDDILSEMKEGDLTKYVKGLYLSSCESAWRWTEGHKILKELGFIEKTREAGHRCFVSLEWEKPNE